MDSIGSAYERGRVLQAVVKRGSLSPETVVAVLRSAQGMASGHETSQVLMAVATTQPISAEARDLYIAAAGRLGNYEESRALSALVKNERGSILRLKAQNFECSKGILNLLSALSPISHVSIGFFAFQLDPRSWASATRSVVASS